MGSLPALQAGTCSRQPGQRHAGQTCGDSLALPPGDAAHELTADDGVSTDLQVLQGSGPESISTSWVGGSM